MPQSALHFSFCAFLGCRVPHHVGFFTCGLGCRGLHGRKRSSGEGNRETHCDDYRNETLHSVSLPIAVPINDTRTLGRQLITGACTNNRGLNRSAQSPPRLLDGLGVLLGFSPEVAPG
jgi:hypothetical protein